MTVLLDYVLTPLARISAGKSGQVGNDRQIHTVLPGTAIRGALGAAWWRSPQHRYSGSDPQAVFEDARKLEDRGHTLALGGGGRRDLVRKLLRHARPVAVKSEAPHEGPPGRQVSGIGVEGLPVEARGFGVVAGARLGDFAHPQEQA